MTTDWNTRMDKLGAERGTWEEMEEMTKERTIVFDGTTEMAERVGLVAKFIPWVGDIGNGPDWWELPEPNGPDIDKGDTLIIDASGRAVGVKGES